MIPSEKKRAARSRGPSFFLPLKKVGWTIEALRWRLAYRRELDEARASAARGPLDVVLVLDHLKPRSNAGKLVRSADALGARELRTVGMPYFNVVPAAGSLLNLALVEHRTIAECFASLRAEGYAIFALEPARDLARRVHLDELTLPAKTAFVVGHESQGVSFTPAEHPDVTWVSIRQHGRVPCLNASIAGSLALYEYARQRAPR